jgi:hypothetical protein
MISHEQPGTKLFPCDCEAVKRSNCERAACACSLSARPRARGFNERPEEFFNGRRPMIERVKVEFAGLIPHCEIALRRNSIWCDSLL